MGWPGRRPRRIGRSRARRAAATPPRSPSARAAPWPSRRRSVGVDHLRGGDHRVGAGLSGHGDAVLGLGAHHPPYAHAHPLFIRDCSLLGCIPTLDPSLCPVVRQLWHRCRSPVVKRVPVGASGRRNGRQRRPPAPPGLHELLEGPFGHPVHDGRRRRIAASTVTTAVSQGGSVSRRRGMIRTAAVAVEEVERLGERAQDGQATPADPAQPAERHHRHEHVEPITVAATAQPGTGIAA